MKEIFISFPLDQSFVNLNNVEMLELILFLGSLHLIKSYRGIYDSYQEQFTNSKATLIS